MIIFNKILAAISCFPRYMVASFNHGQKLWLSLAVVVMLATFSACWPSSVGFQDKGGMPKEWKIFSVKNLENDANNAPLSYPLRLTDDIKTGIQNNTRLQLVEPKEKPQISIEGKVVGYSVSPIALQAGDNAASNRLTISSTYEIFISAPKAENYNLSVSRFADFSSNQDLTSVEAQLIDEINKQIVQDIINKLMSNW
jgi:outer membrane lipopolysaccharide assembly protein LptE/RlpB